MVVAWIVIVVLLIGLGVMFGYMQGHETGFKDGERHALRRFVGLEPKKSGDPTVAAYVHIGNFLYRCTNCKTHCIDEPGPDKPYCSGCGVKLISYAEYLQLQQGHK